MDKQAKKREGEGHLKEFCQPEHMTEITKCSTNSNVAEFTE